MIIVKGNISDDILVILVSFLAVTIVYIKWSYTYWNRKGVDTLPLTFLFGNAKEVLLQKQNIGNHVKDIYEKVKHKNVRYCGYYFLTKPQLFVCDLDLIRSILTKDFLHFTDHINYVNEAIDPLSGNLFSLKGVKWKNLRTKLTSAFSSGKIKMMFQTLLECSNELGVVMDAIIERNEDVDIKDIIGRYTTDTIGSCAFGIDCNSLRNPYSDFRMYGKRMFEPGLIETLKNALSAFLPEVLYFLKQPLTNKKLSKFFMKVVRETVDYRENNNIFRKDFLHLLIQLKNNSNVINNDPIGQLYTNLSHEVNVKTRKTLTMEELAAQVFLFFLAGFETSSTTLAFCFYELASNLKIQQKLREEISVILRRYGGKLTYNAIMEMVYMDKCIYETLRKYPPVPALTRECTQEFRVPNSTLTLKKGTQVIIPIIGIQHDPDFYPNPNNFDPERFSQESKSKRHPYAWLAFGEGPRSCIGLRFGMMQIKIALSVLLRNYEFTLSSKTQNPLTMDPKTLILSVKGGIWLNAKKI